MTKFYTKSFCAIPFVGMFVDSNQKLGFCCMAPGPNGQIKLKNNEQAYAGKHSICSAWNSPTMVKIREQMINGETVAACSNCHYRESFGKVSNRQHSIKEWKWRLGEKGFDELITKCVENHFISPDTPVYLDLRLGNLCNLKCRMCNPWNSSQIAKEHFDLYETDKVYKGLWTKYLGQNPTYLKEENLWFESNFLWDEILSMIPNLRKVYMTGGEPTMVEGNFKFMKACIEMGHTDNLTLFFNLNCTNLNGKFLDLIKQFKNVSINASIDGVNETNEYIRYPSKWSAIDKNFKGLAEIEHLDLKVTPTLTVFNALECDRVIEYVKSVSVEYNKKIEIDYLFNSSIPSFDCTIIPVDYRKTVVARLKKLADDEWIKKSIFTSNSVESLISILESPQNKNVLTLIDDFFKLTNSQDAYRKQSFKDSLPEVYKALNEHA